MKSFKFAAFALAVSVSMTACSSGGDAESTAAATQPNPNAAVTPAAQTPQAPAGPVTTVAFEESQISFGTIDEGEIVNQVFKFTNTGSEPLVLSDARGSCGCTVPQWPKEPVAPGESGEITVQFNSKAKRGKRSQKVTITANTNPPQSFIYLTGEVVAAAN
jgi:hypothetical protein